MSRGRWSIGSMVTVFATVACSALAFVAPATADDGVPRPPGAIDQRGWELVSQADLNGNQVDGVWRLTPDGNRVQYEVIGGVEGSSTGTRAKLEATRTTVGWISRSILPPADQLVDETYYVAATAPDLSGGVWSAFHGLGTEGQTPKTTLLRIDATGSQTILHTFPVAFGANAAEYVASNDLSRVYGNVPTPIDSSHLSGTSNVYDFGSGTPVLVSRMPSTGDAPACGIPTSAYLDINTTVSQHGISTDGSRVLFATAGDVCSDPLELYVRDVISGTTTLISGPPLGGDADHGLQRFLHATPDGSQVFYRTATSLDPADDGDGDSTDLDIYRWTATGGNVCLTCAAAHADVSQGGPGSFAAAVSEDGSHVYFTSPNQLADAPAPADAAAPNLYVWRDAGGVHGSVEFIARSDGVEPFTTTSATEVTPDGEVLIFRSRQPGLDALSGAPNGGFFQYYRYDDRDGSVTCVSCPAGGATVDVPRADPVVSQPTMAPMHIVSSDGGTVVFKTADRLVSADVNGDQDIYEWHDGAVGLITNGQTDYSSGLRPKIVTISPDARDILFEDAAPLVADVQGMARRLYDARIGGGFPPSVAASPAPCQEDACQFPSPTPPALGDPASLALTGDEAAPASEAVRLTIARVSAARRARLAHTGRLVLTVRVSGAGRVSAVGVAAIRGRARVVMHAAKALRAAGRVRLQLRLSRPARAQLARRGRLRVVLVVRCSTAPAARRVVIGLRR